MFQIKTIMTSKYFIILPIFIFIIFFLTGCSSNYLIKDYPSKTKFYQEFNNSVNDERVNVTLTNDSTYSIEEGVVIINDTLFALRNLEIKRHIQFAKSNIADIKYLDNDYKSGALLMNSGQNINVNDIVFSNDSIDAVTINKSFMNQSIIPIDKVRTIDFKNRSQGTLSGILAGGLLGYITGRLWVVDLNHKPNPSQNNDYGLILIAAPIVGIATGLLISNYIGYRQCYHFND